MLTLLREMGIDAVAEYRLETPHGTYWLDIYLPDYHAAIEVDGPQHSRRRDRRRDGRVWASWVPVMRVSHEFVLASLRDDGERRLLEETVREFCRDWAPSAGERRQRTVAW